jgi:hypothetical protein
MSTYSEPREILPERADFLVELRGFEPMAIAGAVRSRAIPPFAGQCGSLLAARAFSFRLIVGFSFFPHVVKALRSVASWWRWIEERIEL